MWDCTPYEIRVSESIDQESRPTKAVSAKWLPLAKINRRIEENTK